MNHISLQPPQIKKALENKELFLETLKTARASINLKEVQYFINGEPFWYTWMKDIFELDQIIKLNFNDLESIIISGCYPDPRNIENYKNFCKRKGWKPISIEFLNTWESQAATFANHINVDFSSKIKSKKFLCLNNGAKVHRFHIILRLFEESLIDCSYTSLLFQGRDRMQGVLDGAPNEFLKKIPEISNHLTNLLNSHKDKFPLILDYEPSYDVPSLTVSSDRYLHEESYFSIVTETVYYTDNDIPEEPLEGYIFSEKTWRPISMKQPFIIVGMPGSLNVLKYSGYKTFHPFINEEYDLENDRILRIEKIIKEVKRLSSFSDQEWLDWQERIKPIVEYNFTKLSKQSLITLRENF